MIHSLTGTLTEQYPDSVVLDVCGVGYYVSVPASAAGQLPALGGKCTLYTYMNISENDISLFGFPDREQQRCFKMLLTVAGVGPKAALAVLSVMSPDGVALAASAGDFKAFTAAAGVGPKLAQRLVLELKDKVAKGLAGSIDLAGVAAVSAPRGAASQAVAALVSLGYSQTEAAQAVARLSPDAPVEELVRQALRGMAGGR